ncbi:MAG TPA: NAD-dependent epimerase/dehydratase family protein [Jatrophihabitans sp.]|nr:NAD-dependent epimerase/dehydratase family protein [Jatrophihabitans sp.]
MKVLVFGGTVFLSRTVAETAVRHGHTVTVFNRGVSGSQVDGVRTITGDRTDPESLQQLAGQEFDLVFDTAYFPDRVRQAVELLEPNAGHYAFTSTINVFAGWPDQADYHAGGVFDGDPDAVGEQLPGGLPENGAYGWRKVGAERAVLRAFGEHRTAILRAGLIVGPHDRAGRLPWWLSRVARGGEVLAPGDPDAELRLIDARDLAEFALLRPAGTFEVTGPAHQISRRQLVEEIRTVTGSDATFRWVADGYLAAAGVAGWTELPLWVPAADAPGLFAHDTTAAEAAGLACRPVRETLLDTWEWMAGVPGGWQPATMTPGLAPDRERELLAGYRG